MEKVYTPFIDRFLSKSHVVGYHSVISYYSLETYKGITIIHGSIFIQSPLLKVHFVSSDPPFCP